MRAVARCGFGIVYAADHLACLDFAFGEQAVTVYRAFGDVDMRVGFGCVSGHFKNRIVAE